VVGLLVSELPEQGGDAGVADRVTIEAETSSESIAGKGLPIMVEGRSGGGRAVARLCGYRARARPIDGSPVVGDGG
jgi:hypothetical protein